MIEVSTSTRIDAVAPDFRDALARLEDIRLWSETVIGARCEGAVSLGVGATRGVICAAG
jgi:hypothetical protein